MRVYPPVPFNARVANKDTILPHGGGADGESNVLVQKGQRVVFSTWATHRSTRSFGDDAYEFRPERWEHLKGELPGFLPFSSGPRACPGRKHNTFQILGSRELCTDRFLIIEQYALIEASYVTVRILQTFSKIRNCDPRPWKERMELNLFNDNGVILEFEKE